MIRVAINGACGRMGGIVLSLALEDKEIAVVAALERRGHPQLGADIGALAGRAALGVPVTHALTAETDVFIDFSEPEGTMAALDTCQEKNIAMVIGATGHSTEQRAAIEDAADKIPVVLAPNMSVGVNVMYELVRHAARLLDDHYDVEIIEAHHRLKKDAPSGTAKSLLESVIEGREIENPKVIYGREGMTGERERGAIGMHSVRAGDIVGDHTVLFATNGERIELTHRAHSRQCFARGAIQAVKFIFGKPPGLYTMSDVLGIKA